jgi:hypothetical protein
LCVCSFLSMFIGLVTQSGALDPDSDDATVVSVMLILLAVVSATVTVAAQSS